MVRSVLLGALMLAGPGLRVEAQAPAPAAQNAQAFLRPGDIVKLKIWREEDWSGDLHVSEAGTVTFPRIGERNVLNVPTSVLRDSLLSAYNVFLQNPTIEITFQHRINILGAVREPGLYHVDRTMTIQDALALAGGAEPDGKRDQIELMRGGKKVVTKIREVTALTDLPLQSGDQLYVPEKNWLSRNTPMIAGTLLSGLISLLIATRLN